MIAYHSIGSQVTSRGMRFRSSSYMLLAVGIFLTVYQRSDAAVINASSVSFADVSSAVGSASDGDTVVIPAGTATWTTYLVVTKGITIQGSTTVSTASSPGSAVDNTVLVDHITRSYPPNGTFFSFSLTAGQTSRLTGVTFKADTDQGGDTNGSIQVGGTCPSFRMDHCHFIGLQGDYFTSSGQIYGVIDHCLFDFQPPFGSSAIIRVLDDRYGGSQNGDGAWADLTYWGSNKFLFIEDNIFNNGFPPPTRGAIDSWGGGRYVARHNILNDTLPNSHGTESSGRFRSLRAVEIYNNTVNLTSYAGNMGSLRGGTTITHDNTYGTSANIGGGMTLACYRAFMTFSPWGGAFGNNNWDSNDAHGVYVTGTASANSTSSGSTGVFTDSTQAWTPNQWVGYTLVNTVTNRGSFVISNTATTISYSYDTSYDSVGNLVFTTGQGYGIYRVLVALDQPGRGKGDLVADVSGSPVNTRTGTVAWPVQALDPCYSWNNKRLNGSNVNLNGGGAQSIVRENREYYNENASFDGTTGVGIGTLASRPGTCTTGVAYWGSDTNTLYQCSATNTWSTYYTPYTYPHPLVTSGGHGPGTPGDLHIMP